MRLLITVQGRNPTSYEVTLCIIFLLERLQARWLLIWFWSWDLHEKPRRAHCVDVCVSWAFKVAKLSCPPPVISAAGLYLVIYRWRQGLHVSCLCSIYRHLFFSFGWQWHTECFYLVLCDRMLRSHHSCFSPLHVVHMLSYVPCSRKSNNDWRDLPPRTEWCFLSPRYFFPTERWDFISLENLIEEIRWRLWMEAVFNPSPLILRLFCLQSWLRVFGLVNFTRGQGSLIASWWRKHVRWTGMEISRQFFGKELVFNAY